MVKLRKTIFVLVENVCLLGVIMGLNLAFHLIVVEFAMETAPNALK